MQLFIDTACNIVHRRGIYDILFIFSSSLVTALFDQMEKEILSSEDFQAAVELVHELHTACQKDVLVKKLFWQVRLVHYFFSIT